MVSLPPLASTASSPVHPADSDRIDPAHALADELRSLYAAAASQARTEAERFGSRYEATDVTRIDPGEAGDLIGCRVVTAALAEVVGRHFPEAVQLHRVDESPAVVDATWHDQASGRSFVVEWDYDAPFGDPAGLTVREVIQ